MKRTLTLRDPSSLAVIFLALLALMPTARAESAPNILLLIGDDMGVETLPCYGIAKDTADLPNLDRLCREGVRFNNVWSQPSCSPTRATMMTGRYGFRTGVGAAIPAPSGVSGRRPTPPLPPGAHRESPSDERPDSVVPGLRPGEFTIARALKAFAARQYETAAIGKWHLADMNNGAFEHPNRAGFDHFKGDAFGPLPSYFAFPMQINGQTTSGKVGYADSVRVDDAIAWIRGRDGRQPWFLWLGFSNPHSPYHLPPLELLRGPSRELNPFSADVVDKPFPYFKAMLEGLDAEIGRLLGSLTPQQRANTYVIFIGDNGTTRRVAQAPFDPKRSKGTVYQGGINVPLVISGPGIAGGRSLDALVNTVDMFATVLDLASIDPKRVVPRDIVIDSISFAPLLRSPEAVSPRRFAYADRFGAGVKPAQAIRNAGYKLVINEGTEELYDMTMDPYEKNNLLRGELSAEARQNFEALKVTLADLLASESRR